MSIAQTRELFSDFVLNQDNIIKLILIYLRIRAKLPIIIQGETGVGKTHMVSLLSRLMDYEFIRHNVNPATDQHTIKKLFKGLAARNP
jgi:MoxR-like ATPase